MTHTATRAVPSCETECHAAPSRQTLARRSVVDAKLDVDTKLDTAEIWAAGLAHDSLLSQCTTIGLISGSRSANPRCVIDAYARRIADARRECRAKRPMLIVRLDVRHSVTPPRTGQNSELPPPTATSPLGPWCEVTVPVPIGRKAGWWLEHLPQWLPNWKREFGFLLVDLGPISEVPSRVIGRLCDGCYLMLGPEACGSHEWLLQHIAWHDHSGCTVCGTLITEMK